VYTALRAIDSLKVLLAPFLPFTCERLHSYLGYESHLFGEQFTETVSDDLGEHTVLRYRPGNAAGRWQASELPPGQVLRQPEPLFRKLDVSVVEEERARLGS
jgi:methionyl-tRNA synthetase